MDLISLRRDAGNEDKIKQYKRVEERIQLLLEGETSSRDHFELRHALGTCVSSIDMHKLVCCRRDGYGRHDGHHCL